MRNILIIALIAFASASYADNCARPQNTFDSLYCARKVFFSLDDDLNKTYKELLTTLDDANKKLLKNSRQEWISERNKDCVNGDAVNIPCAVDMTRQRLNFLQNRLHECKSDGCIKEELPSALSISTYFRMNADTLDEAKAFDWIKTIKNYNGLEGIKSKKADSSLKCNAPESRFYFKWCLVT